MSRPRVRGLLSFLFAVLALCAAVPVAALAAGSISGTVKDLETGTGVAGVEVCAENQVTFEETCSPATGADGKYKINVGEGEYEVVFLPLDGVGYLLQFYKEHDLRPFEPDLVEVESTEVPGIDARLKRGGVIKGQVTDAVTHLGIEDAEVCVNPNGTGIDRCFEVGTEGKYTSPTLKPGSYTVSFWGEENGEYLPIAYNQKSLEDAELVPVTAGGTASGIDGALSKGSSISGTVLETGSAQPLDEVVVCLHDTIADETRCVFTNSLGAYKFGALANGEYKVGFSEEPDPIYKDAFDTQYFNGVTTLDAATMLQIGTKTALTQIDAHLHKTGSSGEENRPPAGGGGGVGQAMPPPESPKAKALKCKKGFKKKTVKGKPRCVRKKKPHRH